MGIRFGVGSASLVLATVISGLVCGMSAQVQTPPAEKAVESGLPLASAGGNPPAAMTSADAKAGARPAEPSSGDSSVPQRVKAPATPKGKVEDSYVVGVADSLFISVWKEPDLSGAVVVRPDGIITVPVVGDVHVAGMTTPQVQDLLTGKLKDVVAEPQVTVIVREIRSRKAYLVGKVGRPGSVPLTSPETVLQILAEAGGPLQFAKPQKMYVLRTVGNHQKRIEFNYKKVVAGSAPDLDVLVGDVIVVP